jgi:nitroreductase
MNVRDAILTRRSIPSFDSSVSITKEEILSLLDCANLAPSSMNLQPWEYLVLITAEEKQALSEVSYNQKKIIEASAVIVVLGNLKHYEHADRIADSNIEHGLLTDERKPQWVNGAHGAYENNLQKQRDEVFRGCSLWSMNFMLAATAEGWDTAPMGGFVPEDLNQAFGIPDHYVPTLLICIGKRNPEIEIKPRAFRYPTSEIAHFGKY